MRSLIFSVILLGRCRFGNIMRSLRACAFFNGGGLWRDQAQRICASVFVKAEYHRDNAAATIHSFSRVQRAHPIRFPTLNVKAYPRFLRNGFHLGRAGN